MKVVKSWSKRGVLPKELVSKNFGDDPKTDWVMQRVVMLDADICYQLFVNIKDTKFKWLVKLWLKLNPQLLKT